MKGPPIPIPPYKGNRFDPPEAWLFAKGIYGPPDERPFSQHPRISNENAISWGLARRGSDGRIYALVDWNRRPLQKAGISA